MFQVVKRDGEVDEFKIGKITAAIHKAFDAKEKNYSEEMIDLLGLRVTSDFQKKITDNKITVEEIQDSVENVLIQAGYADVAKAYILYRKQREKVRNMKSTILDYKEIVNSYVKVEDWRVKENSTVTYSVGGLILSNSGASCLIPFPKRLPIPAAIITSAVFCINIFLLTFFSHINTFSFIFCHIPSPQYSIPHPEDYLILLPDLLRSDCQ